MPSVDKAVEKPVAEPTMLRAWPAVLLVILLALFRLGAGFVPDSLVLVVIFAPMAMCFLILIWWMFFSRVLWRERLIGVLGLIAVSVVATFGAHPSMIGFGTMMFAIPTGLSAFSLAAAVCRKTSAKTRLAAMTISALCGFGVWNLARTDGVWGDYHAHLAWRWTPTDEQEYLAGRANEKPNAAIETLASVDWPGFRGRARNGVVHGVAIATDWQNNGPKELWRIRVGPGWSSFAVAGNWLFTQEQRGEREAVVCYDARDGSQRWAHEYESRFYEAMGGVGPRATPTLVGDRLYSMGAAGVLLCLDAKTGEVHWEASLTKDAERKAPTWGFSSSPLLVGNTVMVHAGGEGDKGVLAYSASDGKLQWTAPAGKDSYSSLQRLTVGEETGAVMLTNQGFALLNPNTGQQRLTHDDKLQGYRVIQPMILPGSDLLFADQNGTTRVNIKRNAGELESTVVWTSNAMKVDFSDFVAMDEHLFGIDGRALACVNLRDGKKKWKRGRYGKGQLLLLPKQKQLLVASEFGDIVLLEANPAKHVELAKQRVLQGKTWNHPVIVGNRLYHRNAREAVCYELPLPP